MRTLYNRLLRGFLSWSIPKKIIFTAVFVIFLVGLFGGLLLKKTLWHLTRSEMDELVRREALALSGLVNLEPNATIDYEISRLFLERDLRLQRGRFFRFFKDQFIFPDRESLEAPKISCAPRERLVTYRLRNGDLKKYRVFSVYFYPELEEGEHLQGPYRIPKMCLVLGLDEAPFRAQIRSTVLASLPFFIGFVVFLFLVLLGLGQSMSFELQKLASQLGKKTVGRQPKELLSGFSPLPRSLSPEVDAVVEKINAYQARTHEAVKEMQNFLARATHQLKTPIAALKATTDLYLSSSGTAAEQNNPEAIEHLQDVKQSVDHLAQLSRGLLRFSKLNASTRALRAQNPVPIHWEVFFGKLEKLFRAQALQKQITLQFQKPSVITHFSQDETTLIEALSPLIENAIHYSPAKTTIAIAAQVIDSEKKANSKTQSPTIRLTVWDQGPGLPANIMGNLYKPFMRGLENGDAIPGSGLGLSLTKSAVDLMNGTITVATGVSGTQWTIEV